MSKLFIVNVVKAQTVKIIAESKEELLAALREEDIDYEWSMPIDWEFEIREQVTGLPPLEHVGMIVVNGEVKNIQDAEELSKSAYESIKNGR
jgi:hypothetical protein